MLALILFFAYLDNKRIAKLCLSLAVSLHFGFKLNLVFNPDKCPECYGDDLCEVFRNGEIRLTWFSYFLSLFSPRWTKSVFEGVLNGSQVVIKGKAKRGSGDGIEGVVLCPSVTDRLFLLGEMKDGLEGKKLWLDIETSIEPLLLMFFHSQGPWPFPKYLGACGDFIMEEHKGSPLSNYLSSDFITKSRLAVHLLKMAELLTFGHSNLGFYLIDYSLDNLVVDSNGGVFFVDVDSVIISNKSALLGNRVHRNTHRSEILDEYHYAFSPSDICSHYISDHNYFSICKYLLSNPEDGLLKEIPAGVEREKLLHLLNECALPSETSDRFSAGQQLQKFFQPSPTMTISLTVFKKSSPNGKITLYLEKRDFVDHVSFVDPIDGIVVLSDDYAENRKIFGQVICSFRYGREEDEVMGLNFQKDLYLASAQIYPSQEPQRLTRLQERLLKKLGPNAYPFTFEISPNAPMSITLQPGPEDEGQPCGLHYYVKVFAGESESERSHRRSVVTFGIRKVQFAPSKQGRQPCTIVRKDFMLSPGDLELEMMLDKQLYHHGDKIAVSVCIRNNSNKVVKKIKVTIQQGVDVVLFQNGQYRCTVACVETQEGCPVQPGSCLQKLFYLVPSVDGNKSLRGVALEGQLKNQESTLASSSLLASPDSKDVFGIIVSYSAKVKLFLGALGGEMVAELPLLLMQPKPSKTKQIKANSVLDCKVQDYSDVATD